MVGALLGIVGILLAIAIPLHIEYSRRPSLSIDRADDLNWDGGARRIVHIKVVNAPLTGFKAKWLLRNDATGCRVELIFRSKSDRSEKEVPGRWSGAPEPLAPTPDGRFVFDATKTPQSFTFDVPPGPGGEILGIAIKDDGDTRAFAFSAQSYLVPGLKHPAYELAHEAYEVRVNAQAGGIKASATFSLENQGDRSTGLRLTKLD